MVAETREKMTEMFENWTDNVRATFDAGRRSQETVFKAVSEMYRAQPEFDGVISRTERMSREFLPFFGKNFQIFSDCLDSTFRTGMEVCKAACDATTTRPDEGEFYKRSRQVWDAVFGAARSNFETFAKAGSRTMENYTEFFRTACCETTSRPTTKPAK